MSLGNPAQALIVSEERMLSTETCCTLPDLTGSEFENCRPNGLSSAIIPGSYILFNECDPGAAFQFLRFYMVDDIKRVATKVGARLYVTSKMRQHIRQVEEHVRKLLAEIFRLEREYEGCPDMLTVALKQLGLRYAFMFHRVSLTAVGELPASTDTKREKLRTVALAIGVPLTERDASLAFAPLW